MTKLYQLPRNTKFKLLEDTWVPPGEAECTPGAVYLLKHIDGMYSYCVDPVGNVARLAVWSEVEVI